MPFLWFSSNGSSSSSFFERLLLLELLEEGRGGRGGLSFGLGAFSVVGEPVGDLLVDVEGTERRPERRGSLGEGGGPIVATLAIVARGKKGLGRRWRESSVLDRVPDNYRNYGKYFIINDKSQIATDCLVPPARMPSPVRTIALSVPHTCRVVSGVNTKYLIGKWWKLGAR